ncbi:MAG: adenylate cyclase [Verrucomicrobiota bacterium]
MANSFHSSRLYGFFCELKRRKVYRVAVGYGVVGWLIIQFATTVLPALTLPAWTARFFIVLVLAGFPIALILAWALDLGPDGIHLTPESKTAPDCPPALPGRRRNVYTLAVAGLVISAVMRYFILASGSSRKLEKSIAVLPDRHHDDLARVEELWEKAIRLDPIWDPLRADSRFDAMLAKFGGQN